MNFSRNFGVFPFQATVRGNSTHHTSQSKANYVMLVSAQSQDAHQNDSAAHLQIVPITHSFKRTASRHSSDITDRNSDTFSINS